MIEEKIPPIFSKSFYNFHRIEGPNGFCSCGLDKDGESQHCMDILYQIALRYLAYEFYGIANKIYTENNVTYECRLALFKVSKELEEKANSI